MRNISFALTTLQTFAQVKTVTRRFGWWNLQPGTKLQGVVKGMGLKKGEQAKKIHVIEPWKVRAEPLNSITEFPDYGEQEMIKEGFPNMKPVEFVEMICDTHKGKTPESTINRIEFTYDQYLSPVPPCHCGGLIWMIDKQDVIRCWRCQVPFKAVYPQYAVFARQ